jgi:hypothetical protein
MRFSLVRGSTYLLAASLLLPAGLWAATAKCEPAAPTPASYTWEFPKEANQLLKQIRYDAEHVQRTADELTTFNRNNAVDWRVHADDLGQAKVYVNRMGADMCRLQTIQRSVLPWQEKAIKQLTPMVVSLVDDTQQAIVLLNQDQGKLFATNYGHYIDAMYNETRQIKNSANHDVLYAQVQHKLNQLESNGTASGL